MELSLRRLPRNEGRRAVQGRLRQEGHEFKVSPCYVVSPMLAWEILSGKKKKDKRQRPFSKICLPASIHARQTGAHKHVPFLLPLIAKGHVEFMYVT